MRRGTRYKRVLVAVLVLAAAVVLVGCANASSRNAAGEVGASETARTGVTGVRNPSSARTPASETSSSFTTTEAQALDAQLRAMEDELETLGLPGDEDVEAIESGLK